MTAMGSPSTSARETSKSAYAERRASASTRPILVPLAVQLLYASTYPFCPCRQASSAWANSGRLQEAGPNGSPVVASPGSAPYISAIARLAVPSPSPLLLQYELHRISPSSPINAALNVVDPASIPRYAVPV